MSKNKKIPRSKRKYFSFDQFRLSTPTYKSTKTKRIKYRGEIKYIKSEGKKVVVPYSTQKQDVFLVENKKKKEYSLFQVTDRKKDRYRKIKTYKSEIKVHVKGKNKFKKQKFSPKQIKEQFITKDSKNIALIDKYERGGYYNKKTKQYEDRIKVTRKEYDRTARINERRGNYFFARAVVESYVKNKTGRGKYAISIANSEKRPYAPGLKNMLIEQAISNATRINRFKLMGDSDADTEDTVIEAHLFFYSTKR